MERALTASVSSLGWRGTVPKVSGFHPSLDYLPMLGILTHCDSFPPESVLHPLAMNHSDQKVGTPTPLPHSVIISVPMLETDSV